MSDNTSQVQTNITTLDYFVPPIRVLMVLCSVTPCLFFLYINGVMMLALRSKAAFCETPRYILFYNMLFSDTFQLMLNILLFMMNYAFLYLARYSCVIVIICSLFVTRTAPLNLAVMSLERYVAICFPLRHTKIVTRSNTVRAIAVVWILSSLNCLVELFVFAIVDPTSPKQTMREFCAVSNLFLMQLYKDINKGFLIFYLSSVCSIIVYSYISIMLVAKSASSSDRASSSKARQTVLLHLFQLVLSLSSTFYTFILETVTKQGSRIATVGALYAMFLFLIIFPRCLSPLVYGLRDQAVKRVFIHHITFGISWSVKPIIIEK